MRAKITADHPERTAPCTSANRRPARSVAMWRVSGGSMPSRMWRVNWAFAALKRSTTIWAARTAASRNGPAFNGATPACSGAVLALETSRLARNDRATRGSSTIGCSWA